jgi:hypothetical protein
MDVERRFNAPDVGAQAAEDVLAASMPPCRECGDRHDDHPAVQHLFHPPRPCVLCGKVHWIVRSCPK